MRIIRLAATLALAGAIAACGGATPAPAAVELTLNASEFAFDPNAVEATAGSEVKFTLANKGTIEHDITIDAVEFVLYAAVGETTMATTAALAAGSYDFYCSIPGHKEAGMIGTLTVK